MNDWLIILLGMAGLIGGSFLVIGITSICCKIEETHETVLWIKDKLDHE